MWTGAFPFDSGSQVTAMFEAYRNSGDFLPYDREQFRACAVAARSGPTVMLSPLQIRLEPFQERLLELIALSRQKGLCEARSLRAAPPCRDTASQG